MQDILAKSLKRFKQTRDRKMRMIAILLVLSLVVSLDVFWTLRQPGLTLAGEADCRITEHTHNELCQDEDNACDQAEHIHTIACYADETADVETQLDWQKLFADYPYTGNLRTDLVGIAKTQVGYTESSANFQVDDAGIRHGYTRYGAWYGAPYNDWSAIFVSFCLHYAGADSEEFPTNTGAISMAELWKNHGKYTDAGTYDPIPGDLVFFTDNTVGIVAEAHNSALYVIRGDIDDAVQGSLLSPTDSGILGWGLTNQEKPLQVTNASAIAVLAEDTQTTFDLVTYLNNNAGDYFFTLLDVNNHEVPKDANSNFIVHAETQYKITLSCNSPNGFLPGTYQYQFTDGVVFEGGKGDFILSDKTNVGTWNVTNDGLVTLDFNQNINNRTEVTLSATLGVYFPSDADQINFDGKITVNIEKPQEEIHHTEVNKWGVQGNPDNAQDPNNSHKVDPHKIYWTVKVEGNENSAIPGSTLSDRVLLHDWSYAHRYTESDMANGLNFGVSAIDPDTSKELFWHRWTVSPGDPSLTWDENGWSYQMPETITCRICGEEILLGNEYWTYFVEYSSTPARTDIAGVLDYSNIVEIDNQIKEGWAGFVQNQVQSAIYKTGTFVSDAGGGRCLWELKATIQGRQPNEKAKIDWHILDTTSISDEWGTLVQRIENDMKLVAVTANYYGKTIHVPLLKDATKDDPYALIFNAWSSNGEGSPVDTQQYKILCRCQCNADNCNRHPNCWTYGYVDNNGLWHGSSDFCECWLETEDITFTFTYETTNTEVIEAYSTPGYYLRNVALLMNAVGDNIGTDAKIPIPHVLDKDLIQEFDPLNGYIAKYRITINEGKLVLTDGSPLTVLDEMTRTLAFMRGTLKITAEDDTGRIETLQENIDYTFTYDGTGNQTDTNGNPIHLLKIVILHPQPVKYILEYDTAIVIPPGAKPPIKYQNSASIELWGRKIVNSSTEKVFPDINVASKNFSVELQKTAADTKQPLAGAEFGMFNKDGGLITRGTTNANGKILFETNVANGIILREHVLYYLQELRAPPGYQLDDTKHWFCFCDQADGSCQIYKELIDGTDIVRVPFEETGEIYAENQLQTYTLPATGGPGIYPLLLVSVAFILTPLVYMFIQRCRRERRGVG